MHSALLVGLLSAKMIGRSLKEAMSLMICSVKAPATAATPEMQSRATQAFCEDYALISNVHIFPTEKDMDGG